jgi:hypothetical protein
MGRAEREENGCSCTRAAHVFDVRSRIANGARRWRPGLRGTTLSEMQSLKAHVLNGRLVLDEPTDLPEGSEVEVVALVDDLEPTERARLVQAIDDGVEDFEQGRHTDGFDFIAQLRAQREAANR